MSSTVEVFSKPFTQQEPICEAGIERAVAVMKSGRLHRYNTLPGEQSETEQLEAAFAEYLGVPYCLACASGGYALHIALKAAGIEKGEPVLTNGFTLAPVPGAIDNAGGKPVLVEIDDNYCIDLAHLEQCMRETQSRFLLLSHMRGHLADMQRIQALCQQYGVLLIEDCAHTMGATWAGQKSGTFGDIACFSTQTYKHLNSGEGGLLTTRHAEVMARATIHSGSYMLYERHGAAPSPEVYEPIKWQTPNYSGRMDNLRAAILNAQLPQLDENCRRWTALYQSAEAALGQYAHIVLPQRRAESCFVGSSLQFRCQGFSAEQCQQLVERCAERGVELKWFGRAEPQGFTSRYDSWHYIEQPPALPRTLEILATTFDLRIPLTFDHDDMRLIARIIGECVVGVRACCRSLYRGEKGSI